MSKESYVRGFVKAAEAAGVDPVALAKYAQEFKTNGWAPPVVSSVGTKYAPIYGYDDDPPEGTKPQKGVDLYERAEAIKTPEDIESSLGILNGVGAEGELTPIIRARAALDPRYAAWLKAHTKATDNLAKKVFPHLIGKDGKPIKISPPGNTTYSQLRVPGLTEAMAKAYHDSMANSTGGVGRVSAPVAKK